MPNFKAPIVFISYAREDWKEANDIYTRLLSEGFKPWIDQFDLLPGQDWNFIIKKAIQEADYFIVLLSKNSNKKESFFRKEFRWGLEVQQEKLKEGIYLIPVMLEECEIPEELNAMQWVKLFWDNGFPYLLKSLKSKLTKEAFPEIYNQPTESYFETASEIQISGITLLHTITKFHKAIVDSVTNGSIVKIILAGTSDQVLEQISLRSWAKTNAEYYRNRIASTISRLKVIGEEAQIKSPISGTLQVGHIPFVPSFGLFISNPNSTNGVAFVEIYHHLIAVPPRNLVFLNNEDQINFRFYRDQFEAMWNVCQRTTIV
jgi:hypothetical protein